MVEVTQQDRDAAADWGRSSLHFSAIARVAVREGRMDKEPLVKAFAQHRIATEAQTVAEIVAWLERWGSENDRLIAAAGGKPHREAIAAIRSVLKLAIVGIKGGAYK